MRRTTALGGGAEFDLIRRFLRDAEAEAHASGASDRHLLVGPGDDCAVLRNGPFAISVDMAVEGVHFRRDWLSAEEIGYRSAIAAFSDLAAVAAEPVAALVSIALPLADRDEFAPAVLRGVRSAVSGLGASVVGGDVARTDGPLTIDVVAVGHTDEPVLRSGAREGDLLWVTGELGAAGAAVHALHASATPHEAARAAYARPGARVREARWLQQRGVPGAMIDVSDGVAGDAAHIAAASGVQIEIDAAALPVHAAVRAASSDDDEAVMRALRWGDDYELLFTAPPGAVEAVRDEFVKMFDVRLSPIGRVRAGEGVMLRGRDGSAQPLAAGGYDHFRESNT